MSGRKSIIDYEFEPKRIKFACEACDQEFKSDATLLRHVSHKRACKDHYGEHKLWEMRRTGKLLAAKKWKKANRPHDKIEYKRNKCKTNNPNLMDDKNETKYSYVPEGVRKCTYPGVAFFKYFKIIYQTKKEDTLENLKVFAREMVYKKCVDFTLDKVFNEEQTYRIDYENHGDLEKALQVAFENRIEKKITQDVNEWIDYASIHLSKTCLKQSENFVFNNYFGKFRSDIFPILQGEVLDLVFDFTDEDFNKIEEHERKDRMDRRIYEFFFFRYVRLLDNELSKVSKQTPLGELGSRIEDKIGQMMSKQVKFLKIMADESSGTESE